MLKISQRYLSNLHGWWRLWVVIATSILIWCGYKWASTEIPIPRKGIDGAKVAAGSFLVVDDRCTYEGSTRQLFDKLRQENGKPASSSKAYYPGKEIELQAGFMGREFLCMATNTPQGVIDRVKSSYGAIDEEALVKNKNRVLTHWLRLAFALTSAWAALAVILRWVVAGFHKKPLS